jgi:hypothetical protein
MYSIPSIRTSLSTAAILIFSNLLACSDGETELVYSIDQTCRRNPLHVCCSAPAQGTACCQLETYEEPACYFELLCISEPTHACCAANAASSDPCCNVETALTSACIIK